QACHYAYWCLLLETLHHLVKHSFVPAVLEQAARLPGLTHKDLERAGFETAKRNERPDEPDHKCNDTQREEGEKLARPQKRQELLHS
ncbi:MAG TPA: hypothetical protein VF573_10550, partial [Paraburkholderia sp.]|uniref:hypothetical protein n=1 Tax=Paraburkholderia sp. TaxID=1926495 RepID=UPI002ED37824